AAGQVLAEEWYANHGIELVVDQRTGRVIYAQVGPRRTLRAPGATKDAVVLLDSRKIAFDTATQRDQVRQARRESGRLRLLGGPLPIGAAATGFVLAVVGGVLLVRGRRDPGTSGLSGPTATM
ncbi:porin PorA family protein, partial [Streptomyces sp. NPDC001215]